MNLRLTSGRLGGDNEPVLAAQARDQGRNILVNLDAQDA